MAASKNGTQFQWSDPAGAVYRTKEEVEREKLRDPITLFGDRCLKEGVLTPDIYDADLNPLYRDVLAHYGAVAMPCRIQDPDRKGKVESGVGHAQKTPLKGKCAVVTSYNPQAGDVTLE